MVLSEEIYVTETTLIHGQTRIKEIEKQEWKILRKIFGTVNKDGMLINRPSKDMYKNMYPIKESFRKRRVKFFAHSKNKSKWIRESGEDLKEQQITIENI